MTDLAPLPYAALTGDPAHHLDADTLLARFLALPPAPTDLGRIALLVARGPDGRLLPERVVLRPGEPLPGDRWQPTGKSGLASQLTVIRADFVRLLANGQPTWLSGDNLQLDLDLSAANLPIGSQLRVRDCLLEVTPKPHTGCKKFAARFGRPALELTADPRHAEQRLRGLYLQVVAAGEVRVGDAVSVVRRGPG